MWARSGTRPRALRDHRFNRVTLFGAICPARGVGSALMLPVVSVKAMNKHLAEISTCVSAGAIALLVIDGAGWHRSPRLKMPDNIVLLTLPPYAPELNPVENVRATLRANRFAHQVWETDEAVVDATCAAWNALIKTPDVIHSLGHRSWAKVKT